MSGIFDAILYKPLFNLLIWLYTNLPGGDIGFAIITISVLIKLLVWPLTRISLKSQRRLQEIQPRLEELKEEHKDDKEALAKAMMDLYKEEEVSPFSSCLPMLVQLPLLFALYAVLQAGLNTESLGDLYSFVAAPEYINSVFLGIVDLAVPSITLACIAGVFQFIQTKMLMAKRPQKKIRKKEGAKDEDMMAAMNKYMVYMMPVMTVFIGASLPGGLTLYWIVINILSIIQQALVFGKMGNKEKDKEPAAEDSLDDSNTGNEGEEKKD